MWKKILTMSLVLVMVLSLAACTQEPSAQEIVDGVIESFDNIRTYQFDMDETVDMTFEEDEASFALGWSGTVDVENRQVRMETTNERIPKTGQPEMLGETEIYFIDGMLYIMLKVPGEEPAWTKEEAPEEWWEEWQQTGWGDQIELLEAAQVKVIGSERVDGIDCYVLEVTPDLEQLWQLYNHMTYHEAPDVTEEYLREVFHSFSVKQWVAKDTYFLTKAKIDIATEFPPEEPGPSSVDIAMVLLSYNYNQPVTIVLPPEAEEANQLPPLLPPPPAPALLPPPVPPETIIAFPDKNLAAAIRDVLGTPTGDNITAAELATLTMLDASKYGISDLTGIEYCVNLKNLFLGSNQISDISPLSSLTNLNQLSIGGNQISNISPLSKLTSLTGLTLGDNQISDISPLSSLVNLTNIYIWGNKISDTSPLSSLVNMNQLNIGGNQISNISPFENLTSLTWLNLDKNQISDISPLENLTSLTWLSLEHNEISDISPLQNLTSLTGLRLHENQISNISPLQNLTSLTDLWLLDNQISDISPLENLTRLYALSLEKNEISDISPLSDLANLTELWLWDNQISDIYPLASLTNLTRLGLWGNQISDISPLSNLTRLYTLSLEHNEISDISPLQNLANLTELWLWNNQISDISPISNLTNLTELRLSQNQISDIYPLVENSGLGEGDEVWLEDNNLEMPEGSEDMENIRALEDRGVVVHY